MDSQASRLTSDQLSDFGPNNLKKKFKVNWAKNLNSKFVFSAHFRLTFHPLPVWNKIWPLVLSCPEHLSIKCKWSYNFAHNTARSARAALTAFFGDQNSNFWLTSGLLLTHFRCGPKSETWSEVSLDGCLSIPCGLIICPRKL